MNPADFKYILAEPFPPAVALQHSHYILTVKEFEQLVKEVVKTVCEHAKVKPNGQTARQQAMGARSALCASRKEHADVDCTALCNLITDAINILDVRNDIVHASPEYEDEYENDEDTRTAYRVGASPFLKYSKTSVPATAEEFLKLTQGLEAVAFPLQEALQRFREDAKHSLERE